MRLLGEDMNRLEETERTRLRRQRVGTVLQFGQRVPDLSVLDNVALPLLLDRHDRAPARTAAAAWLEHAGLVHAAQAMPAELSGGQSQRVAAARALVTGPAMALADEPTGSMDTKGGELLLDLPVGARERGTAVVLVTHDNLVAARADREVRLRDRRRRGRVGAGVTPATMALLARPG